MAPVQHTPNFMGGMSHKCQENTPDLLSQSRFPDIGSCPSNLTLISKELIDPGTDPFTGNAFWQVDAPLG